MHKNQICLNLYTCPNYEDQKIFQNCHANAQCFLMSYSRNSSWSYSIRKRMSYSFLFLPTINSGMDNYNNFTYQSLMAQCFQVFHFPLASLFTFRIWFIKNFASCSLSTRMRYIRGYRKSSLAQFWDEVDGPRRLVMHLQWLLFTLVIQDGLIKVQIDIFSRL